MTQSNLEKISGNVFMDMGLEDADAEFNPIGVPLRRKLEAFVWMKFKWK